jgi:catalase
MVTAEPFEPEAPDQATAQDKNYLFDALIARIEQAPLQLHLIVTIGQPDDPTNDATTPWPDNREHVDVGTLTIGHIESEAPGNCRDINFDPLVLPFGIAPSDDPLLSARSAAYSQSFTRRAGEKKEPSAVRLTTPARANDYGTASAIHDVLAYPALDDGSHDSGHAVHRRRHGRFAVGLSLAGLDP